ncbi:MAG: 7TM diverse intracellular signaling domain-containing protein [Myxococcota bacterium]|nr:7TM diverse intracellular signaling domain-containing protein [Myxococcota bacterium]
MLQAAAAPSLILSSQDVYSVNEHFDWVTTPASVVDYQSALEFFDSAQAIPTDGINLGFTEGVVWLRANLISHSSRDSWILEFAYPHLDDVDVYVFQGARAPIIHEYGDGLPFDARFRRHRTINAEIQVPPGETVQVLARVQSTSALQISLKLYSQKGFGDAAASENLFLGLYYGLMGIMMVYHLILFLSSRMRGYFLYACYVGGWTLAIMVLNGTFYQYFLPNEPLLMARVMPVVLSLAIVFTFVFIRGFLELSELMPSGDRLLRVVTYCALVIAILGAFIPYKYAIGFVTLLGLGAPLMALSIGIYAFKRGFGPAKYFVWGWSFFLIGALVYSLRSIGLLPAVPVTEYAIQVGTVVEVLFLSLALGDRISALHSERDEALHALIAQSQMLNEETERRAKAEESLRIELQGRVTLFSDAAHHLNNPLNHIDGAKRSIRRQSRELESVVMELINDDDGVEEVQTYLKERFENIRNADHVIENAVLRTARVVETLRAVSGVDGVGYEKASVVKVLNVALERLEAILGRDGAASKHLVFGTNLDELEQVKVIGQPSLYGLALDLLIEAQVAELHSTNEGWKLHLKLAVAKGGYSFHRLRFWIERESGDMVVLPDGTLITESVNSIIGVYGASAVVYSTGEVEMTMCAELEGLPEHQEVDT